MTDTPKNPEVQNTAEADAFKKFLGERANDHFYNRLIEFWKRNGKEGAQRFCYNDSDKFIEDDVIRYYSTPVKKD